MSRALTRREVSSGLGMLLAGSVAARAQSLPAAGSPGETLADALARIEAGIGGRLGVAIHEPATGLSHGHRSGERFPMCSTAKVLACGAVLARVDAGSEDLGRRIRFTAADLVAYSPVTKDQAGGEGMTLGALCEAAMTLSDNSAANLVLASVGGPAGVTAFARRLGDPVTRLDRNEPTLNTAIPGDPRDTTTPDAMASDLAALALGDALSSASRDQVRAWLLACRTGDAKLRAGVPAQWQVGDKTGSGDFGTTNDVAVLWPPDRQPLVTCVYITDTKSSFDACNAAIAAVGRAVAEALGH